MKQLAFLIILFLSLQTCQKNSDIGAEAGVYRVDPIFEPYVQEFIAEGAKRGQTIDFSDSGLIVEFSDVEVENAAGFCYIGRHHVVIDKSEWTALSEDIRGFLLFHELGHCELDRRHRNEKFSNNVWRSIMRGSPLQGNEPFIPIPFFGFRKAYFLDELFDENIAPPDWANQDFSIDEVPESSKELIVEATTTVSRINQRFNQDLATYEFEIDFDIIETGTNRARLVWGTTNYNYYLEFLPSGFAASGYFIGVQQGGQNNNLFYSTNTINVNGGEVHKITVRREGGFEKIFLNDTFIFHLDPLPNPLQSVRFDAKTLEGALDNSFKINEFVVKAIQ